jgi:ATP-binding cassette subfamily B protein
MVRALWLPEQVDAALLTLAHAARLPVRSAQARRAPHVQAGIGLARRIEQAAASLGLEIESVDFPCADVERGLRGACPALVRIEAPEGVRVAALLRVRRKRALLVGPQGTRRVRTSDLCSALTRSLLSAESGAVDLLLDRAGVSERRRKRIRAAWLRQELGGRRVTGCYVLRCPAGASFVSQLRTEGALGHVSWLVASHMAQYFLALGAWWVLGRGALRGNVDSGWLAAWALLLVSRVPLRLLERRAHGRLAVQIAGLIKQRLLLGALAISPEQLRGEGIGQLLGRILEANAVETAAVWDGLLGTMAVADLVAAMVVLALGAAGALHDIALTAWVALLGLSAWSHGQARRTWTDERLGLTHDLVEQMAGHRTRIAQLTPGEWHVGEDARLAQHHSSSRTLDHRLVLMTAILPAAFLVVGLAILAPEIVGGAAIPWRVAISLWGLLLAVRALEQLASGARGVTVAMIAWQQVKSLCAAGRRVEPPVSDSVVVATPSEPLALSAHNLVLRHRGSAEPVLSGCTLRIAPGDRLLLEGPSGGGKSSLAHLLGGVRAPESGMLLLGGLDQHALGLAQWRRQVVVAPQFHENHVISATFAFNLLMGRGWPPTEHDLNDARDLCRELGLGELLERMPLGLHQMIGETGWQLSHGERSRLYMARALLQSPDVLVLDESFAALDAETVNQALPCVTARARSLLLIAHP